VLERVTDTLGPGLPRAHARQLSRGVDDTHPVASRLLRLVHGEVGLDQKLVGGQLRARVEGGDAHAHGEPDAALAYEDGRLATYHAKEVRDHDSRLLEGRLRQHDRELVTP
jgi:hypothetical protein